MHLRTFLLTSLLAAITLPALAPLAGAGNCDSSTLVFSYNSASPGSIATHGIICLTVGDLSDVYDTRIINPGSDEISIRYAEAVGETFLFATLNGLGYEDEVVRLDPVTLIGGGKVYDSTRLAIDPALSGTLEVTVTIPATGEVIDSVAYHTVH